MNRSSGTPMDVPYRLLGDRHRRYLLYQLQNTGQGTVESLASRIATVDPETADGDLETARQQIYVSLVHNHLPRLADHGVLEYDLRSGDVVLSDGFTDLEPLLEQFKETEDVPPSKLTALSLGH